MANYGSPANKARLDGPQADRIVEILALRPGCSARYLADQIGSAESTVRRLLGEMEERGTVRAEVSPLNASKGHGNWGAGLRTDRPRGRRSILKWSLADES